ncbi:ImmA/IrrE family metallo-endopeptidase [Listeria monocytogenes]|nr:ImmA/IrrE family metallo-endopeptidase [Listeria monocytogenes]
MGRGSKGMNDGLNHAKFKAEQMVIKTKINHNEYSSEHILNHIINQSNIDTFDYPFTSDISGILVSDSRSTTLTINSKMSKGRCNFSKAHELGHYFLHIDNKSSIISFQDVINKSNYASEEELQCESEADMFAGHLIIPDFVLIEFLRDGRSFSSICKQLVISKQALRFRIKEILIYVYHIAYWKAHNIVINFENMHLQAMTILRNITSNIPASTNNLLGSVQYNFDM